MTSVTESFENNLPRLVITGRGRCQSIVEICHQNGWSRVLMVSDSGVAAAGLLQQVSLPLCDANLLADTFVDVPPEPKIEVAEAIASLAVECRADVILGLGGGSVMDATKVAALVARHGQPARSFIGIKKAGKRGIPTILIPTTAGTGSEATFVAILTDPTTGNKVGVVDPCILADIAIVDPTLTDRLPQHITAAAGMDAMVHAIEAYLARVATPLACGLALQAARHIGRSLEVVCREPENTTARDDMAIGSHLAGMAFANSSCCAVHALALPLGGRFPIPHGVITGCIVGELMRHNAPASADGILALSNALGWGRLDATSFADKLDSISRSIGLQSQLAKTLVPREVFSSLAADAVAIRRLMDPNPRDVTQADAERIYETVLERSRSG
jgi:alcohol dehydrogenase